MLVGWFFVYVEVSCLVVVRFILVVYLGVFIVSFYEDGWGEEGVGWVFMLGWC